MILVSLMPLSQYQVIIEPTCQAARENDDKRRVIPGPLILGFCPPFIHLNCMFVEIGKSVEALTFLVVHLAISLHFPKKNSKFSRTSKNSNAIRNSVTLALGLSSDTPFAREPAPGPFAAAKTLDAGTA
jgi:hypothetical protein